MSIVARSPRAAICNPEADLIRRIRAGDEAAFESLFRTTYQSLLSFARQYVHSTAVAEDIVQEVFLRVWEQRATWVVKASVRAYLFGATRNRCLNHLDHERVAGRWRAHVLRTEASYAGANRVPTPEDEAAVRELRSAIRQALAVLPERARLTASLRWEHGLSYAEVAEAMGISTKGVENQLHRIMKTLERKLAAHHTGVL